MSRLLLFLAALGAIISAPGRAQQLDDQEDAVRALHIYGGCIVRSDSSASSILGLPPGSRAERSLLRQIANPRCISGHGFVYSLDYEPQLLRGAIAEEVLRLGDGTRVNGRTVRWVSPFTVHTTADIEALDDRGRSALRALDFAQCILADAPDPVATLLDTTPATTAEERAIQQLAPYLGPCLEAGAQMTIAKPQLRSFLAEAEYRRAYAASRRAANPRSE